MRTDEKALVERLRMLAPIEGAAAVRETLEGIRPEDIAEALQRLGTDEELAILRHLDAETAAYVLIELPTEDARAIINQLPDATVAHYLDILPMDDAIELREELDPERFEALLHVIPREDAQEIRRLLSYPEESAGQLMTEDFAECTPEDTMMDVLRMIRQTPDSDFETVNYIYVLSEDRHLLGLLSLKRVIRSDPMSTAREVMHDDPVTILATDGQEEAARMVARYGFSALPVLDERGRMVGIITADDAQEILEEAETEDVLRLGGVSGDAEAYLSLSIWQLIRRRLPWLLVLFIAEFFTGSVLRYYTGQAEEGGKTMLAQMMLFVPLLIGAGGNSGSQVTTTITRSLALGEVKATDWFTVMVREATIALMIGSALGFVGFLRAKLPVIGWNQPMSLSLVVGFALPAIVLWAATVGSLLPITAKRLGFDPAVMSAPFITTFVDATGLVIYFEIARRVLGAFHQTF
ncbi:magnesium transporter [Fimbriimonas ginsengisoli]|uniref:Magnesium transporter MgtE n=1 Tax=Fimbriimonas ginsengisoli Gsoil 348 TaxID=661478 RepID=A0A068NJI1_FIMGI|nr:magnesium transporter [Fimbriimonas ginsengisoli]AIE83597.1 Magnesium transporter [Fimbriimonas ginsengisoli Gsoil 348]